MFVEERQSLILEELHEKGKVRVKELSERFQVSEDLIRKDLTALEEKLKLLEISDIPNKDEMIINCKHDIEKQKRIISHTTSYLE